MKEMYDIVIVGSGPIASSAAYHLTLNGHTDILMITEEPTEQAKSATYKWAGGSIRWFWDEPEKARMTKQTADFIKKLILEGTDLAAIQDNYLFLHRGVFVPSLNVSGPKLVQYFLDQAIRRGLVVRQNAQLNGYEKDNAGYTLNTAAGVVRAKTILLATGVKNKTFIPELKFELEKRQLFVLDLPVDENRQRFPHTIAKIGEGVAYVFVKNINGRFKILVGQEDIIDQADSAEPEDYFDRLMKAGLETHMPFLQGAVVEDILWGYDASTKTPLVYTNDNQLYAANCGSAVRSCVAIGELVAKTLRP